MLSSISYDQSHTTARDIRRINRIQILHQLLLRKTSTRQELSQLTGLSTATVANLVNDMLAKKLVIEAGIETPQIGRPTAILAMNAAAGLCVGIDVAETYIQYDLYDISLSNVAKYELELPSSKKEPDEVVNLIISGLDTLLQQAGMNREQVVGIGISIPGPFEHSTGVSVFGTSWGWVNVPFKAMLEKKLKIPLYIDNPLKFNVMAEAWFGVGQDANTMAAVVMGTGVGVGLVINNQLFHGSSNTAGEWGHTVIVAGGRVCRCGNRGCLEAYVGAPGILQTLMDIDQSSSLIFADDQTRSIGAIAAAAELGDPTALAVVRQTAFYLGAGLGSLINIINPEAIILGSWVANKLGNTLLPQLHDQVKQHSLERPYKAVQVVLSSLSKNPVSLGAATVALEEFLANGAEKHSYKIT